MNPLITKFKKNGFIYSLVKRDGDVAMFSMEKYGHIIAYEVVVIQQYQEWTVAGITIQAHEGLPSTSMFGTHGWAYSHKDKESAENKYKELCQRNQPVIMEQLCLELEETAVLMI